MNDNDIRTAWIAWCTAWAMFWLLGSLLFIPLTLGLSLFGMIGFGGAVWAMWIPVGRPNPPVAGIPYSPHPQQIPYHH